MDDSFDVDFDFEDTLEKEMAEAKEKVTKLEKEAGDSAADKGLIASLQNEVEDAQIEKKLAEDRVAAEMKKAKEDSQQQVERFAVRELELKNEISGMESRIEALRARAEEASSTGQGESGESSVTILPRRLFSIDSNSAASSSEYAGEMQLRRTVV